MTRYNLAGEIPGIFTGFPDGGWNVFHQLASLLGMPVVTRDGEKRPVRNFLFDDQSWEVRFVVVDVSTWLAARQVVIATSALEAPDWAKKTIRARLTLQEVLESPDAETVRPVSRQQQLAWNRHFGWPDADPHGWRPSFNAPPGREFVVTGKDDPHLRRTLDLTSYQVWGDDGLLGRLEGFFVSEDSWRIGYLLVRSEDWIYRDRMISTRDVEGISWGQHRVLVDGVRLSPAQSLA